MSSFLDFYPTEGPDYFFLSYNKDDADQVAPIASRLSREGIALWYDYGIAYSEKWAPQLAERIVNSQGVILFFTKGILAKDDSYVKKEYRIAKSRQKKVHIILLDKIADADVPNHMLDWWFDITDQQCIPAYDLQPGKLISEIKRALGIEKQARPSYAAAAMEIFAQAPVNKTSEKLDPAEILLKTDPAEAIFRENAIIENGVLVKYTGSETHVCIPNGVTSIGDRAFSDCQRLTSVTIPNSVTTISDGAFSCCFSLTSVTIPGNVTQIGKNPFRYCRKLTKIAVSPDNPHFIVENGHLIDKRTKTLITGCASAPIPENSSVHIIGEHAFAGCDSLTSVTIPYSVSEIQKFAFSGCDSLRSVIIPGSVFKIEAWAFSLCESLRAVIFQGSCLTTIDWRAFEKCSEKLTVFARKNSLVWKWAEKNRIRVLEGGKDRQINLADYYRQLGLCQHCGGELKGILSKTCADCGKKKDY